MKALFRAAAIASVAVLPLAAQDPKPQLPKSQLPDLGRPTRPTDEQPAFRFGDYFVGKWTFEWDAPEGPLGPSGLIKGTVVYRNLDPPSDRFYEATTTATGPGGPFTIKETIVYRADGKTATRVVTDSRGMTYPQLAAVGGDLGGYFNLYFESAPFTFKGKTVQLRHAIRTTSPLRYRMMIIASSDGGAFQNYGTVWFEKDASGKD